MYVCNIQVFVIDFNTIHKLLQVHRYVTCLEVHNSHGNYAVKTNEMHIFYINILIFCCPVHVFKPKG
jgi:hypothetical protein